MQSEQDPPAPVSARALKIPEILSAIGDCFYLTYGGEKYTATNRDKLRSILAFIRVSKLWNRTFLPILWYSFDPATMGRFSEHAILTNSLRLKILTAFRVLTGPFDCSNLHTLEILKGAGYNGGPDISLERQLVRANPGLNSLRLRGPTSDEPIALDVEGLAVLESLHELELHRWDNNHLPFETLRPMAATLTALNLCRIKDFSLGNPMDVDGPTSGRLILQQLEEITMDLDPNCWTPCRGDNGDFDSLATSPRKHCPLLQELTIRGRNVSPSVIQKSSAGGLVSLRLENAVWSKDLFSAILLHSGTLVNPKLEWESDYGGLQTAANGAKILLELLHQCLHLRTCNITWIPWKVCEVIFDEWSNQKWACTQLGTLGMHFTGIANGRNGRREVAIEGISGISPLMGWYRHTDNNEYAVVSGTLKLMFELLKDKKHIRTLFFNKIE